MRFFFLFLAFSVSTYLSGQDFVSRRNASEKVLSHYKKASNYMFNRQSEKAEKELLRAIKREPKFIDGYLLLGELYRNVGPREDAYKYFKKASELAPDYDPKVFFILGKMHFNDADYPTAIAQFNRFLSYPDRSERLQKEARKMQADAEFRPRALAAPVPFKLKNLGPYINTPRREYFPTLTADQQTLIYSVEMGSGRTRQEDLFFSVKKEGKWTQGLPLPGVNTRDNEAAQCISADGKMLVFTVCNRPNDYGSCDLYYSELQNGRWTPPKNMGPTINTTSWESQPALSPNRDALYFTRGQPRGHGHKDIYVSYRKNNSWTTPTPLQTLNTEFDESGPFMHPDGRTLYFASNGHPGMGKLDLFKSTLQEDGSWSTPQNLGYPLNTEEYEEAIYVSTDGQTAYIASARQGGSGSMDIYSFELHEAARPTPTTFVQALVRDAQTKKPLIAQVQLQQNNTLFADIRTNAEGTFMLCMPLGKSYGLAVDKKGYLFHSERFTLDTLQEQHAPFQLIIELQPLPKLVDTPQDEYAPIVLKNVLFETNSARLRAVSKTELNRLFQLLEQREDLRIQINGHTDNRGTPESNMTLSQARAESVRNYLIKKGIQATRLQAQGFGETRPIQSNDSTAGRQANRRTEFQILP